MYKSRKFEAIKRIREKTEKRTKKTISTSGSSSRTLLKTNLEDLGVSNFVDDFEASGSSDIGNVSQVCPTVYCEIDTGAYPKVFAHHETFLDYVHGKNARITLDIATKAMAYTALQIFLVPQLLIK